MYFLGNGVGQNIGEAIRWYKKAAHQELPNAQYDLAMVYEKGVGVEQNLSKAARWFTKAASQGHAKAQFSLGSMFKHGRGVPLSHSDAATWFSKAADQGKKIKIKPSKFVKSQCMKTNHLFLYLLKK